MARSIYILKFTNLAQNMANLTTLLDTTLSFCQI